MTGRDRRQLHEDRDRDESDGRDHPGDPLSQGSPTGRVGGEDRDVPAEGRGGGDEIGERGRFSDDEHLGWRISALLDGELGVTEEIVAREHLVACDRCQDEFAQTTAARNFVRALGQVEPRKGFVDRLALGGTSTSGRRRRPPGLGLLVLGLVAVMWTAAFLLGVGVSVPEVAPAVEDIVVWHVASGSDAEGVLTVSGAPDATEVEPSELDAPFAAPAELGVLPLQSSSILADGSVHLIYANRTDAVSLFQFEGTIDLSQLPGGAIETSTAGDVWVSHAVSGSDLTAAAVTDGPLVSIVVTSGGSDAALAWLDDLPGPTSYTVGDRVRRNGSDLLERLGLGG